MVEIKESESNRTTRQSAILLTYLFIIAGSAVCLVQFLFIGMGKLSFHELPFITISLALVIFGCHLRKKVARISAIGKDAIELESSKQKLQLSTNDIVSISKAVRFTLTERVWLIIAFKNLKGKKERWFFQTEQNVDLIRRLKEMGITLKNLP